ncbi:hypothetical protein [Methylorubrum suomiense]|uniref:DUF4178 domain-containing protein n=1 Tax=Methylorubrum suomiense TaxID=144191 RepID=A0ABQ4V0R9_9HYPH|nr:hypothetical protein [Methylorubrum suomiense]GJE77303.1 hypothetical protein BGCPKDLD_3906 [Methylorubrum suomiense]
MTIIHKPDPPEAAIDINDKIYAQAIQLAYGPSRRRSVGDRFANLLYWAALLGIGGWFFAMAIDRTPPVKQIVREVVNEGGRVRIGERLLIHGIRVRERQCELVRRWWLVDGAGRRIDYQPEPFDAYGPVGREEETFGPYIPLDAMPGRGRLYGSLSYDCNVLQRALGWSIVTVLPPLEFEILPRAQ